MSAAKRRPDPNLNLSELNAEEESAEERPSDDLRQNDQVEGSEEQIAEDQGGTVNGGQGTAQQAQVDEPLTPTVQNGIMALDHRKSVLLQKVCVWTEFEIWHPLLIQILLPFPMQIEHMTSSKDAMGSKQHGHGGCWV